MRRGRLFGRSGARATTEPQIRQAVRHVHADGVKGDGTDGVGLDAGAPALAGNDMRFRK